MATKLPQLMKVSRAAALLDVDPSFVRRKIYAGELTAYQIGQDPKSGHGTRVDAAEIEAFLARRRYTPRRLR